MKSVYLAPSTLILVIILQTLTAQQSHAQGFVGAASDVPRVSDSRAMDAFRDLSNRVSRSTIPPENIRGSYYFQEDFKPGKVIYFGKELKEQIYLRHNGYTDEMEIWKGEPGQRNVEEILLKSAEVDCIIDGEYYKLLPYRSKSNNMPKIGYLIVLSDGPKYKLYMQRKKVFMEASEARTSLERSLPARFNDETNYYFSVGEETPVPLNKSKRAFVNAFKGKERAVKDYIKTSRNRLKTKEDLKAIFEHFNN